MVVPSPDGLLCPAFQFYAVQVRAEGGGPPISELALTGRLASIMAEPVATASTAHPVGILTTQRRDKWAEARQHLIQGKLGAPAEPAERMDCEVHSVFRPV